MGEREAEVVCFQVCDRIRWRWLRRADFEGCWIPNDRSGWTERSIAKDSTGWSKTRKSWSKGTNPLMIMNVRRKTIDGSLYRWLYMRWQARDEFCCEQVASKVDWAWSGLSCQTGVHYSGNIVLNNNNSAFRGCYDCCRMLCYTTRFR